MSLSAQPRNGAVVPGNEGQVPGEPASPLYGFDSPTRYSEPPRRVRVDRLAQVRRVSVLPPRDVQGGKPTFRLHLAIDPNTDPSSHSRRTGTLEGLELDVEERELASIVRLSGRAILVHYVLWDKDVDAGVIQQENAELREELELVKRRLRETQDQLRISVESQLRDQRQ